MPEVSVVLPVYNGAATLLRAVQSILEQTFCNLELIVIDDGSTDDTNALLRSVTDPRLRVIEQAHRGVAAAANAGTAAARASIIARMDADDVSHPERIERQLLQLGKEGWDVIGCRVRIIDSFSQSVPTMQRYESWINEETRTEANIRALRFVEFPLVNPTLLARRHYFELGYREGPFPEDYDLMLRAAHRGLRFGKADAVLFDWYDGADRLTRSDTRYTVQAFDRCRREHLLDGPLRDVACVDLWGMGRTGKPWLTWLERNGVTVRRGYDIDEKKTGATIHGVAVRHGRDLLPPDGTPLLIAVGAAGARALIRPQLEAMGYRIGDDAWFAA